MITQLLLAAVVLTSSSAEAATALASAPRAAQDVEPSGPPPSSFDYRYFEAGIAVGELDGFRVEGSLPLTGPWIALGRFEYLSEDDGRADVDYALLSGGVGYVHPLRTDLDFIGSGEIVLGEADVDTPGTNVDDDDVGLRARGGVRYQVNPEVEFAGGLSLNTVFDEDLGADARALYAFDEHTSGFVGFDLRDESFVIAGVRFNL